jgi:hypothetical protein
MRFSDKYLNRIRRFISFLVTHSVIAPLSRAAANPVEPLVVDYQEWLKRHRGFCELTTARHGRMVMRLLPALGRNPRTCDSATIRKAIPTGSTKLLACLHQDDDDRATRVFTLSRRRSLSSRT